jgi:hypothetical protein
MVMWRLRQVVTAIAVPFLAFVLAGADGNGCGSDGEGDTEPMPPTQMPPPPSLCPTYNAGISPPGPPQHLYGQPGSIVVQEMSNIGAFWNSSTQAIVYGPDQPNVANNALSEQDGYIYYDPAFLQMFDQETFSFAPSQMILAHEFGHQIQFFYQTFRGDIINDELGADCYSGYFISWLMCNKAVNQGDLQAAFVSMCQLGNSGDSIPWWAPGAHGNCQQRTTAFSRGLQTYAARTPPLNACTF